MRLIPQRPHAQHVADRARYLEAPRPRSMGAGLRPFAWRKDGTEFPIDGRRPVSSAIRDSLQEKGVTLKEIHHRVKNNLAVV